MVFFYLLFHLILTIHIEALKLFPSPDQPTFGEDFNLTCSFNNKANDVVFFSEHKTMCKIRQAFCSATNRCDESFIVTCNKDNFTLTIPYLYDVDKLHGTSWTCQDVYGEEQSNTIKLDVTVPITVVNLYTTSTDIKIGDKQTFNCATDAGRPYARIEWYLDETNITSLPSIHTVCKEPCNDRVISTSLLEYTGNITDHGKSLYCMAYNMESTFIKSQKIFLTIQSPNIVYEETGQMSSSATLYEDLKANPKVVKPKQTERRIYMNEAGTYMNTEI